MEEEREEEEECSFSLPHPLLLCVRVLLFARTFDGTTLLIYRQKVRVTWKTRKGGKNGVLETFILGICFFPVKVYLLTLSMVE